MLGFPLPELCIGRIISKNRVDNTPLQGKALLIDELDESDNESHIYTHRKINAIDISDVNE